MMCFQLLNLSYLGYPKAVCWGLYFSYSLSMIYLKELKVYRNYLLMIVDPNNFSNISGNLELLELWEAQWCLKFNVQKCMVMQIGLSNPKNQYSFGGESLRCVDNEKDLGVTFNSSFTFEDHARNSMDRDKLTGEFFFLHSLIK